MTDNSTKKQITSYQSQVVKCHLLLTLTDLLFNEYTNLGPNKSFKGFLDVWKHDWTTEFWGNGFRCEDIILLHFCL